MKNYKPINKINKSKNHKIFNNNNKTLSKIRVQFLNKINSLNNHKSINNKINKVTMKKYKMKTNKINNKNKNK
mgnify:CR=1 FL=1|jgi:hypothetical protein